ncbi:MAG: response regulator transcription factor [Ignavibacteria bacterium]
MKKIHILIIEDNRFLREGLAMLIDEQRDLKVVSALENKEKLEPEIQETRPDIILIDLSLHGVNSLQLVKSTSKKFPKIKFIVMDLFPLQEDIFEFVKAGASGFIVKDAEVSEFLQTIRSVFRGKNVMPSNLMGSLFTQIMNEAAGVIKESRLIRSVRMTKREKQVIALIGEGSTNKEIGQTLHLSPSTVKSHVHNILEKLAMHNRIEIARYAHSGEGAISIQASLNKG